MNVFARIRALAVSKTYIPPKKTGLRALTQFAYHTTGLINKGEVEKRGLLKAANNRILDPDSDQKGRVYVSASPEASEQMYRDIVMNSRVGKYRMDKEKAITFKIDLDHPSMVGRKFRHDSKGATNVDFYTDGNIPPNAIVASRTSTKKGRWTRANQGWTPGAWNYIGRNSL